MLTAANRLAQNTSTYTSTFTSLGPHYLYVTQTVNGCESPADTITVTINGIPSAPVARDTAICFGQSTPVLTSTGSNVKWYTNKNLGSVINTGNNYTTGKTGVGAYTYYVTQTVNNCRSLSDSAKLTINAIPAAPYGINQITCAGDLVPNLNASGSNVAWYGSPALTTVLFNGNSFPTGKTAAGQYVYYATNTILGCQSPATPDTLFIKASPAPPVVKDTNACFGGTVPNLTAIGSSIKWYADPAKTNLKNIGNPFETGNTAIGTYTYYVTQTINGCEGSIATQSLQIYDLPVVNNILPTNEKYCNTHDGSITISATDPNPLPITYSIDNGSTFQSSNSFKLLVNGSYTVIVKNSKGCYKPGTSVTINPGTNPPAPVVSPNASYCSGASLSNMTANGVTGGHLKWYSNAALTNLIAHDTSKVSPTNTLGTKNYFVYDSIGTCKASSTIKITVNSLPTVITTGTTKICNDGSTASITFNFTGQSPFMYAFTDGLGNNYNIITSNNPEHITTSTQGTYQVTSLTDGNGCPASSLGGSAIIKVNPLPTAGVTGTTNICNDGVSKAPVSFALTGTAPWNMRYKIGNDTVTENNIHSSPFILNTSRAGTYSVVAVSDSNLCSGNNFGSSAIITSDTLPAGTITGSASLCNDNATNAPIKITLTGSRSLEYCL